MLIVPAMAAQQVVYFNQWHSFADHGAIGSYVNSSGDKSHSQYQYFLLSRGNATSEIPYPYAGVEYSLAGGKSISINKSNRLRLVYKSDDDLVVNLKQEGIPPGEEFYFSLPRASSMRTIDIPIVHFQKPGWAGTLKAVTAYPLTAVKIQLAGTGKSAASLWLRSISLRPAPVIEHETTMTRWAVVPVNALLARHEHGMAMHDDQLYVIGGRGSAEEIKPTLMYDMKKNSWQNLGNPPLEMHHVTPIVHQQYIVIISGYTHECCDEQTLTSVYLFDTKSQQWSTGSSIPPEFRRGAAGIAAAGGYIYVGGGLTGGHHQDGTKSYRSFHRYDPDNDRWARLPDMPRNRDHFNLVAVDDKIYAIAGRDSSASDNSRTVAEVDYFDLDTGKWQTLPVESDLPVPRSGTAAFSHKGYIYLIGGESYDRVHDEVSRFDTRTGRWEFHSVLAIPRHGMSAVLHRNRSYVISGATVSHGDVIEEADSLEVIRIE